MKVRHSLKSTALNTRPADTGILLVSACLAGVRCRFDGSDKTHSVIKKLVREGKAIPVCPEKLGGLKTPRPPAEIAGGDGNDVLAGKSRIIDRAGQDVTAYFLRGAQKTLGLARRSGIKKAVLKTRSPSCGFGQIYDGAFQNKTKPGDGVTAVLLSQNGIEVTTEETFN